MSPLIHTDLLLPLTHHTVMGRYNGGDKIGSGHPFKCLAPKVSKRKRIYAKCCLVFILLLTI